MNRTSPWLSIVEKGGGYWIKVDTMWITKSDEGKNIFTVSLSDDKSGDSPNLYSIGYVIHYEPYVAEEQESRPEIPETY